MLITWEAGFPGVGRYTLKLIGNIPLVIIL